MWFYHDSTKPHKIIKYIGKIIYTLNSYLFIYLFIVRRRKRPECVWVAWGGGPAAGGGGGISAPGNLQERNEEIQSNSKFIYLFIIGCGYLYISTVCTIITINILIITTQL